MISLCSIMNIFTCIQACLQTGAQNLNCAFSHFSCCQSFKLFLNNECENSTININSERITVDHPAMKILTNQNKEEKKKKRRNENKHAANEFSSEFPVTLNARVERMSWASLIELKKFFFHSLDLFRCVLPSVSLLALKT